MSDPRYDLPLPSDTTKRLERLARDLAWGFLNDKWPNVFYLEGIPSWGKLEFSSRYNNKDVKVYLADVWENKPPNPAKLVDFGYVTEVQGGLRGDDTSPYKLTETGLQLVRNAVPGPIFISYRRIESTAFAVLLSDRLRANQLIPFLDNQPDIDDQGVALKPGGQWRSDLKAAIEAREYLVVLVGPSTLNSSAVCEEIQWALASHKKIIPVWHRGFDFNNKVHFPDDLPKSIREVITDINAIPVIPEDPNQYEVAIKRLLSVFGINS